MKTLDSRNSIHFVEKVLFLSEEAVFHREYEAEAKQLIKKHSILIDGENAGFMHNLLNHPKGPGLSIRAPKEWVQAMLKRARIMSSYLEAREKAYAEPSSPSVDINNMAIERYGLIECSYVEDEALKKYGQPFTPSKPLSYQHKVPYELVVRDSLGVRIIVHNAFDPAGIDSRSARIRMCLRAGFDKEGLRHKSSIAKTLNDMHLSISDIHPWRESLKNEHARTWINIMSQVHLHEETFQTLWKLWEFSRDWKESVHLLYPNNMDYVESIIGTEKIWKGLQQPSDNEKWKRPWIKAMHDNLPEYVLDALMRSTDVGVSNTAMQCADKRGLLSLQTLDSVRQHWEKQGHTAYHDKFLSMYKKYLQEAIPAEVTPVSVFSI